MSKNYDKHCSLARAISLIGGRWTILILRELLNHQSRRFHELHEAFPGMAPNTLSERLKKLEDAGVVERDIYEMHPPRAHYSLTEIGKELRPIISAMEEWGKQFLDPVDDKK